ncbi:MAG: magnesium-translocating P-type ATPase [Chloroflexi bacterium]|nr:magnesium-translocating P-type ATPase [Chloroflexota bacterium]
MVERGRKELLRGFWNVPLPILFDLVDAAPEGLSATEARRRLARYGPNDPSPPRRYSALRELVRLLLNPLVVILLVASAVTALLGDLVGSLIVIVIVALSVALDFWQTHQSQAAAQRLAALIATTATARRDGQWREVPFSALVPGDVIALSAGDLVPADCRLVRSRFLSVNQAALTGESFPVDKDVDGGAHRAPTAAQARNAVFLGSSVVSGTAEALVVNTGGSTELGHVGRLLRARPATTAFERGMHDFALLITRSVAVLVLFVFFVNAWFGRPALDSFLFAVALAVGLTPEFMPMIVTVILARGALRMAKKRVIVRHPQAIQDLGSIDVLCADKTGTLTAGRVEVAVLLNPFSPDAGKLAILAYLNASLETGLRNPLDDAIRRLPGLAVPNGYEKVDELPFDFVRRRISVALRTPEGRLLLVTKGAPESVLPACRFYEAGETRGPLTAHERAVIEAAFHEQSQRGYRSLIVAYRDLPTAPPYTPDDESDLVFVGVISFEDPPLDDVAATIVALRADGVRLKIVSGDDPLIARHVCERVGLRVDRMLSGPELEQLSDPALEALAEEVDLFARVTPMQKNRIVGALKARHHVVGFLGDGINDAPALRSADVGLSVSGAADVAREAADIILLEKSLAVLHDGIREGRRSYGNMMKYIMMATSSNFGNMVGMAGATLFLPFLPLLPMQILLNNLLYDLSQVAIPTDAVDLELTAEPRQWNMRLVRDFMLVFGPISSLFDYLTFAVLLFVFNAPAELFRTGWFMESLATQILVIYVLRTLRPPWASRPSRALVASTVGALLVGLVLPFSPANWLLAFQRPPPALLAFLALAVALYLAVVALAKQWFFRHHRL